MKIFKNKEKESFYTGLRAMSKQIKSMLDLCKELKRSDKETIELIKTILILE